jgi:hypothetical protein
MAVAIGLGAYELALLAAGALAAMFLASPQGQQSLRDTAQKIGELGHGSSEPDPPEKPDPPPRLPPIPYIPKVTSDCPEKAQDKPPEDDDYCKKKWNEINDQLRREREQPRMGAKGLKQRWLMHACNPGNWSPGGSQAIKHLNHYIKQRDDLARKIDREWKNTRCAKKGYRLPPETEKYLDPNKAPVLGSKLDIDGNPIDCSQVTP